MVVVTEVFVNLADTAARARGFGNLRRLVLPHPLETRSADEIVAITRSRFDHLVQLLCGPA